MLKAVLDLNSFQFKNYQHLDLTKNWHSVNAIRLWLRARAFNLTLPIFVTENVESNTLTFFQTVQNKPKTTILMHPNPAILKQLNMSLNEAGHKVHSFSKVKDSNEFIAAVEKNKVKIDKIIVPKNLEVSYNFTYKDFLNKMYPNYEVITVDDNEYRDTINLRLFKKENTSEIR